MGVISQLVKGGAQGVAGAVVDVAETFRPNATRQMELEHQAFDAALAQHAKEIATIRDGWFDRAVNGMNRLPRPLLALGTLGLFVYAMCDPLGFSARMAGLDLVPEPLWWLLGAIVSFYFGARELHYRRDRPRRTRVRRAKPSSNAALQAWRSERGG
ncbi:holin (3TMs family) [Litoreibacter ponti]|uniref:Holin (3TMs family) n=1 Tax=Litoreibacter ponti TaxID=1510457 RepID=A0A2T6BIN2_9RHOB|nr:holin family protein [Litoreibacter ponti]PTX55912.1 holin (3TMs family) [Litoreibacter ponti]